MSKCDQYDRVMPPVVAKPAPESDAGSQAKSGAKFRAMRRATRRANLNSHSCRPPLGRATQARQAAAGAGGARCFGQLVLSVDLAPPRLDLDQQASSPCDYHTSASLHNVDLSLCVRQNNKRDDRSGDETDLYRASSSATCDTTLAASRGAPNSATSKRQRKRELIYERIDQFPWPVDLDSIFGRQLATPETDKSLADSEPFVETHNSTRFELPFRGQTFDACFCFNLLNIRLANIHDDDPDLAERLIENDCSEQVERNWIEMEQLTTKFRVDFLQELSRIVKPNGE